MGLDISVRRAYKTTSELAYFRKVNFLVAYFFGEDYQETDNCRPIEIYKEQCEDLVNRCKTVLEKKDEDTSMELLPPVGGFFFGDTDIDEYYYEAVEQVRKEFEENVIPEFDELEDGEFIEFWCWW